MNFPVSLSTSYKTGESRFSWKVITESSLVLYIIKPILLLTTRFFKDISSLVLTMAPKGSYPTDASLLKTLFSMVTPATFACPLTVVFKRFAPSTTDSSETVDSSIVIDFVTYVLEKPEKILFFSLSIADVFSGKVLSPTYLFSIIAESLIFTFKISQ